MRLIDADELMEHVWIDKLDSRELIAKMIDNALTVKEISTKIPINVFEQLISQEPKTGHWILTDDDFVYCSECEDSYYPRPIDASWYYCPHCGAKMDEPQESEEESERGNDK